MQYDLKVRGRKLLAYGILAILAGGGVAAYLVMRRGPEKAPAMASEAAQVRSESGNLVVPGRIEAIHVVAVPVPVDGRIEALRVEVGDQVHEGQVLAQIRSVGLESERDAIQAEMNRVRTRLGTVETRALEQNMRATQAREEALRAREEMEAVQKDLLRKQMLYKEGALKRVELEQAQKAFEAATTKYENLEKLARIAEGRVEEAKREVDRLRDQLAELTRSYEETVEKVGSGTVVSPVDGVVVARRGQTGQEVNTLMEDLFQIAVDLSELRVVLEPDPAALEKIQPGQEAIVQIAEMPDGLVGQVVEKAGNKVYVEFKNPNPAVVKPGMTVHVVIRTK